MSSCRDEVVRMIIKTSETSGVVATVPPSDNHQDGSWDAEDVYKGEFFFNRADGRLFIRDDNGIKEIPIQNEGYGEYIAIVTQSGTSAPTATVIKNTIGTTLTWAYSSTGVYFLNAGAGTPFSVGNSASFIGSFDGVNDRGLVYPHDDDTIRVETYISGVATNGVLRDTLIHIRTILP